MLVAPPKAARSSTCIALQKSKLQEMARRRGGASTPKRSVTSSSEVSRSTEGTCLRARKKAARHTIVLHETAFASSLRSAHGK